MSQTWPYIQSGHSAETCKVTEVMSCLPSLKATYSNMGKYHELRVRFFSSAERIILVFNTTLQQLN